MEGVPGRVMSDHIVDEYKFKRVPRPDTTNRRGPDLRDVSGSHAVGAVGLGMGRVHDGPPRLDGLGANGLRAHEPRPSDFRLSGALSLEDRMIRGLPYVLRDSS